jgi:hypothetical protein
MTDLSPLLWALVAYVDQLTAEYQDPTTTQSRKDEIRLYLKVIYDTITGWRAARQ